jgi:hypothetical protein
LPLAPACCASHPTDKPPPAFEGYGLPDLSEAYRIETPKVVTGVSTGALIFPVGHMPISVEEFNQKKINREYQLGYNYGSEGIPWMRLPSGDLP